MQEQGASEELFHGKLITLRLETIPLLHGGTRRFEIIEHPDAVAVVGLRPSSKDGSNGEPEVVLVSQEHPAIRKQTWEIPAGLVEKSEHDSPLQAAVRELREASNLDPQNSAIFEQIGDAEAARGRTEEAKAAYQSAIDLAPDRAARKRLAAKLK